MARQTKDLDTRQPRASVKLVTTQPGTVGPTGTTVSGKVPVLQWQHPVYSANIQRWKENERRMIGGDLVLDQLRPFPWEKPDMTVAGSDYWWRQQLAIYPNLPDKLMTLLAGHLMRSAPRPDQGLDFGTLGKIGTPQEQQPSRAEQVYFSCNTPGITGMPWDPWWEQVTKRAGATGHRWIVASGPPAPPKTRADEKKGNKPFLIEYSPTQVPAWYHNRKGQLEFIVIKIDDLDPQTEKGSFSTKTSSQQVTLLMVREGCTRLGPGFSAGGWWMFDSLDVFIPGEHGDFSSTDGEIPAFIFFYEECPGTEKVPMISRPATTEIGNVATSLMNLTSAANFDAWDGAKGVEWLRGVDLEAWDLAMTKQKEGSRWLPLPPHSETDAVPEVSDSGAGAMQSTIFTAREESLWKQAQWLGIAEAVGGTQGAKTAAGTDADFSASQMPRIVQVAMHLQAAQNMAIYYLERLFGNANPTGQAVWPTRFNLVELTERIKSFFEAERLSGLRCTPLDTEAMLQLAVEKGLIADKGKKEEFRQAFLENGKLRDQAMMNKNSTDPTGSQNPNTTAVDQAHRLADDKVTDGSKGSPGRPGAGASGKGYGVEYEGSRVTRLVRI